MEVLIPLRDAVLPHIAWWEESKNLDRRRVLKVTPAQVVLVTDASRWG